MESVLPVEHDMDNSTPVSNLAMQSSNEDGICPRHVDPPSSLEAIKELPSPESYIDDIQGNLDLRTYVVDDTPEDVEEFVTNFWEKATLIEAEENEKARNKRQRRKFSGQDDTDDAMVSSESKRSKSVSSVAMLHKPSSVVRAFQWKRNGELHSKNENFAEFLGLDEHEDWRDEVIEEAKKTKVVGNFGSRNNDIRLASDV